MQVSVLDKNDNAPMFGSDPKWISIVENTTIGEPIGECVTTIGEPIGECVTIGEPIGECVTIGEPIGECVNLIHAFLFCIISLS